MQHPGGASADPGDVRPGGRTPSALTDLATNPAVGELTAGFVRGRHRLGELALFDDVALAEILDRQPAEHLMALTMGSDPSRPEEWTLADSRGCRGEDLLRAVHRGRLWLNVLHVERHTPALATLRDDLGTQLAAALPDLQRDTVRLTLLVSSADAMVYYHADPGPNLLLHVRGEKQVRVYPARDERFAPRELVEDICAGVRIENLPYLPEFERQVTTFDLGPGDYLAWPQNAPHRVVNQRGINVSVAVEFRTRRSERRVLTWCANRFLGRTLHLPCRSTRDAGAVAAGKRLAYRVGHKLGVDRTVPGHEFVTDLRVDADAPTGLAPLGRTERIVY